MLKIKEYENINQIMLGRDVNGTVYYWVAAYYIDGLLIDTGCYFTAQELMDCLKNKKINTVINTHFHEDHIGGNILIQKNLGIDIYAHPDSIPLINKKADINPYQEIVWGYPEPTETKPIPKKISTNNYTFDVFETPGHSIGHISLIEPNVGWCFSGDIFISEKQKIIRPDEDINIIIESLKIILNLKSEKLILFTSTGGIFENGRGSINNYIKYIDNLKRNISELNKVTRSPEEIRDKIFGRESKLEKLTNGHYSILNFVKSIQKDC